MAVLWARILELEEENEQLKEDAAESCEQVTSFIMAKELEVDNFKKRLASQEALQAETAQLVAALEQQLQAEVDASMDIREERDEALALLREETQATAHIRGVGA